MADMIDLNKILESLAYRGGFPKQLEKRMAEALAASGGNITPGAAVNAASKIVPQAAPAASGIAGLLEGSPLSQLAGYLKNIKLNAPNISPAKANILAMLAPAATESLGMTDLYGGSGWTSTVPQVAMTLGYLGFGPKAIAAGLPAAAMGKGFGEYSGTPNSDYATRAWLEFNPASKYRGQRIKTQQPEQQKAINVTPTAESTTIEGASGKKPERSLFDKMILVDGMIAGRGGLTPQQMMSLRAKAATRLLEKTPKATDEDKLMLGSWISNGASTFSEVLKQREESGGNTKLKMLELMGKSAASTNTQNAMMDRLLANLVLKGGPAKAKQMGFGNTVQRPFPWFGTQQIDPMKLMEMITKLRSNYPTATMPVSADTEEALGGGTTE